VPARDLDDLEQVAQHCRVRLDLLFPDEAEFAGVHE
jgi:hypothetical protein